MKKLILRYMNLSIQLLFGILSGINPAAAKKLFDVATRDLVNDLQAAIWEEIEKKQK